MNFVVPVPSETFDVDLEDGAKIRVRRHGNPDGVRLTGHAWQRICRGRLSSRSGSC